MTAFLYILIAAAAVLILISAFWTGIVTRTYRIGCEKIPDNCYLRIVQISDLHSTRHGKAQKYLINTIKLCMPDIVVMTGDIVDDIKDEKPSYELFGAMKELNIPVFYVCGNHETNHSDFGYVMEKIRSYGIHILDGDSEKLSVNGIDIIICGTADPMLYQFPGYDVWEKNLRNSFMDIPNSESVTILLSHRPEMHEIYAGLGFDITFCGHAHGGQIRIPGLLNGLYSPGQGLFPKYAGGVYAIGESGQSAEVVSRGLSVFWNLPRIFNPPEIVCAILSSKENKSV